MTNDEKNLLEQLKADSLVYYPNFITFEGGEGSGKSTVIKAVQKKLEDAGHTVFITREPGGNGTDMSEAIRELILSDRMREMEPITEGLLYAAARGQHVREVIIPKLEAGEIVLVDRYIDSSIVYQGLPWGNLKDVLAMNLIAINKTMPEATLFFDVLPEEGIKRVFENRQNEINHLDERSMEFHEGIYKNYLGLMDFFPERYKRIDASQSLDAVIEDVYEVVLKQMEK